MSRFDREWVDELKAKNRLLEAELRKEMTDRARVERERDEARAEVKSLKSVMNARFSWATR